MLRILVVAAAALLLGIGLGFTSHRRNYGEVSEFGPFRSDQEINVDRVARSRGPEVSQSVPKVEVVDGTEYDFGVMEPGGEGHHRFVVRNVGEAPLELNVTGSTCKCTVGKLSESTVQPGEQTEIKLSWVALSDADSFRQSATIRTNDPTRGELRLKIHGRVISRMTMVPRSFNFGEVSGEPIELESVIYSFVKTPIVPVEYTFSNPTLTELSTFEVEEVSVDELDDPAYASATQAFRLRIKIAPGMPQGAVRENFSFGFAPQSAVDEDGNYDPDLVSQFVAETSGKIVGAITMVESRKVFNAESGYVYTIGQIDPENLKPERANIMLRGPLRNEVSLSIGDVEPAGVLHAELGEPIGRSSTVLIPLILTISPDAPPMDLMGKGIDDFGIVWINSDNPQVSPLRLRVRFSIPKR